MAADQFESFVFVDVYHLQMVELYKQCWVAFEPMAQFVHAHQDIIYDRKRQMSATWSKETSHFGLKTAKILVHMESFESTKSWRQIISRFKSFDRTFKCQLLQARHRVDTST